MIYSIGCDMSKDTFDICLVAYRPASQHYQVKARTTFDNIAGGWNRLLRWAGRQVPDNADQVRCSLEATGVYHEGLALHVRRQRPQWHLSVVLPSQARCYANSRGLRNKTDKIDAYGIALMGAERRLQSWGGIDPFWRALRQLTRTRVRTAAATDGPAQPAACGPPQRHAQLTGDGRTRTVDRGGASRDQPAEAAHRAETVRPQ